MNTFRKNRKKYFNITLAILIAILGAIFFLPPPQNTNAGSNPPCIPEDDCCPPSNIVTCIDDGSITGRIVNASEYVCWDPDGEVTLFATASATEVCGTQEVVTINSDCSVTTNYNPVCGSSYTWEISGPDYTNGVGLEAQISTTNCGIYTATFHLDATNRPCPPPSLTLSTNLYLVKPEIEMVEYIGIDLSPFPKGTNSAPGSVKVCPDIATNYEWTVAPNGVFNPEPAPTDTSVTVEERGEPSSSHLEELLTVKVYPGGCTAQTNFTIVEVDISLQGKDEKDEIQKGGNIPSNHDDDNYVDLLYLQDMFEQGPISNETDLVMFTITLTPEGLPTNEFVTLTGIEHMYEDDEKFTNAVGSYCVDRFPLTLYIDGQEGDESVKELFFTATHDKSGAKDKIKYIYIQADVDLPFFGPKTNISNSIDPEIAEYTDDTWGTYLILNDDDDTAGNLNWDFQDGTDIKTVADSRFRSLVDWKPHDPGDDYPANVSIDWDKTDKVAVFKVKDSETGELEEEEVFPGDEFDVPGDPELVLYAEGKQASDDMKDIEMTFTYTRDSAESVDKIKVSVVSVDIDGDSNHDEEITDDDDEVENSDQYPVAVMFNDDDDDTDDVLDNLDNITNGAADLDKMTDIYIREVLPLDIPQGVVKVSGMENVRLFRPESTGDTYVELTNSYDLWNELPITLKAEGVTEGKDTLIVKYEYFGNNDTNGQPFAVFNDKLIVEVFRVDMDIDSDHTANIEGGIERSELEDAIESGDLSLGNQQHLSRKYIVVNDYYDSNSGVPGYADNQTVPGGPVDNGVFVPMKFQTYGCLDESNSVVRFSYTEGSFAEGIEEEETIYTSGGNLKLWKKPQGTLRDTNSVVEGGDFIPANTDIPLDKIGSGEIDLYIEGFTPSDNGLGTELISVSVANDSSRANGSVSAMDEIKCTIIKVDVDIDSNNNNDFDTPSMTFAEDHYEDIENDNSHPGKFICVNDNDDDSDGIPDFADGYNLDGVNGNDDDTPASTEKFTPIIFKIPEPIVLSDALVRLSGDYIDSDPLGVTTNIDGMYILPAGDMRLWLYDGSVPRNGSNIVDRSHIITKGEYTAEAFGFTNGVRTITCYLEGIRPSSDVATTRILFEVDPDGVVSGKPYPEFIAADAVRMTVVKVDIVDPDENDVHLKDEELIFDGEVEPSGLSGVTYVWSVVEGACDPATATTEDFQTTLKSEGNIKVKLAVTVGGITCEKERTIKAMVPEIVEVNFQDVVCTLITHMGGNTVSSDATAEWTRTFGTDDPNKNNDAAYKRNTSSLGTNDATCKITCKASDELTANTSVQVKADGNTANLYTKDAYFSDWTGTIHMDFGSPLRQSIHQYVNNFDYTWYYRVEKLAGGWGDWVEMNRNPTHHNISIVHTSNSDSKYQWVVMNSCKLASGVLSTASDKDIVDKIYKNLPDLRASDDFIITNDDWVDANKLKYGVRAWTTDNILDNKGGMCQGWCNFFNDLALAQGISTTKRGYLLKNTAGQSPEVKWYSILIDSPGLNQTNITLFSPQDYKDVDKYPFPLYLGTGSTNDEITLNSNVTRYKFNAADNDGHAINFLEDGGDNYLYDASFGPYTADGIISNVYSSVPLGAKNGSTNNAFRTKYFNSSVQHLYGKIWYRYATDTQLDGAITNASATITVDETTGADASGTIRIEDEIIFYTAKTATNFTGCARGQSGTTATSHSDNTGVELIKTESGSTPPSNFSVPTSDVEESGLNVEWVEL